MRLTGLLLCVFLGGCARWAGSSPLPASGPSGASTVPLGSFGYKTLFRFPLNSTATGALPYGGLINVHGNLYGTTQGGGAHLDGTVFRLTPAGAEKVIYSFKSGSDGAYPVDGALIEVNGVLYGTTSHGGAGDFGTVFKITTAGAETTIYAFKGGKDGVDPSTGLTDVGGELFGTTLLGGSHDDGTVFKTTTAGAEKVVYAFKGGNDGARPTGTLTDVKGTLYGTTQNGGGDTNDGTVFKLSTAGKEKVIHSFTGTAGQDGENPFAGLTELDGMLYGTTCGAGVASGTTSASGTVFKITTAGKEKLLHTFSGDPDGACPGNGNLTIVGDTLFGTTTMGGTSEGIGAGTIYKITTSGDEEVLHSFQATSGNDGTLPESGLVYLGGQLYGTTSEGGGNHYDGTAYQIRP
jgi:uncharacterized repeat protein (TIGR03803 family)